MRPPPALLRWIAAVAVMLVVAGLSLRHYFPPLPNPLTLDVTLGAEHEPGRTEPLITSGRPGAGDFLFVAHRPDNAVAIGYEAWGEAGKFSAPIPLPPDRRLRLTVAMPGLSQVRGLFAPITHQLRVTVGEKDLFNQAVKHHLRLPTEIRFGENSIGGTACGPHFSGTIRLSDGRELRGSPTPLLTFRERLRAWLAVSRWQAVTAVLLGVATYFCWPRLPWPALRNLVLSLRRGPRAVVADATVTRVSHGLRDHRWFAGTASLCTLWFAWMVSYGSFDLLQAETFGDFYDHQATSLLHGRLDVPPDAIGGEAFVFEGRTYGYFGLTPAVLRLPFVIYDFRFGELGRAFMTAYFALALLACYGILRAVYQLSGRGAVAPPAWATVCFVGSVGAGSTLFYLGSRAYIYHEAILCGAMFALASGWAALRHYGEPHRRWWLVSLLAGVLSVNARPPTGFFALTLLGALALAVWVQQRRTNLPLARRQLVLGALCGLGVFTFNITSYLKFRTFEGCPLRYNVQYDAARLARIDGKQFHLVNVPIAIDYYLVRPNFRFEAGFPYFLIGATTPARPWLETKIDYHDNTLGFPYAMPSLVWLATIGGLVTFARIPKLRVPQAASGAAGLPMALAMFAAIAITHRYTADFCPFLIVAAAWGLVGYEALSRPWRGLARFVTIGATIAAILITAAITLHHQGKEVWGVPDEVRTRYADLCRGIDTVVGALTR